MTLVYQAYGLPEVMRQTLFSVTSLFYEMRNQESLRIVIYTDTPDFFKRYFTDNLLVHIEEISKEQIKKWRGQIDFVHRVKIEILKEAAKKFPGPLFYSDGDTYFRTDPRAKFSEVNDQTSLMHICEGTLGRGPGLLIKKMYRFAKNKTFDDGAEKIQMGPEIAMWNAGVIGLAEKNKNLLDRILRLTDEMHAQYPKHVTEQLSVSYYLQTKTRLISCENEICHYWNQKPEYQTLIDAFLSASPTLAQGLQNFARVTFPLPLKPKERFWQKILRKNEVSS